MIAKNPPNITAARIISSSIVEITWKTGEILSVDLHHVIDKNPVFEPLQDIEFFNRMTADEWGHALEWPGGLDIGSDRLYDMGREQAGLPTIRAFNEWMERNEFSLTTAAEAIGMTRRMIAHYRTGSRPIPRSVWLACIGWDCQHRHHSRHQRKAA
ncbi:MAG: DUF2442 domain-containing protein [Candidatus Riflebacteria bacterium]|nr:DUF2442 domain-containing protein [Candidatus Riflebacteria bacterium]